MLAHGKVNGAEDTVRCDTEDCSTFLFCESSIEGGSCSTGDPSVADLSSLGFDTLDFQNAINFVFPLTLPTSPL